MSGESLTVIVPQDGRIFCRQFAGKRVRVSIAREQRSNQQLRWYRGVALPLLAEHLGYDRHEQDDLHDEVLVVAFGTRQTKGGVTVPAKRTGDLNTKEMAEFQEWFMRWAAMVHGCVIPAPNETEAA